MTPREAQDLRNGLLFISPWIVGFCVFLAYPIAMSFYYSLCDFSVLQPARFVGTANYQQLFRIIPGFRPPSKAHSVPTNPARALTLNVNGVSYSINNTRIDGASSNSPWLPHVSSFVPTLDAIETVNHFTTLSIFYNSLGI